MKIPISVALSFINKEKFCSIAEAIDYSMNTKDWRVWKKVINRSDFADFIHSLNSQELLKFAVESNSIYLWRLVLSNVNIRVYLDNISPVELLSIVKNIENELICNEFMNRSEIQEFINS